MFEGAHLVEECSIGARARVDSATEVSIASFKFSNFFAEIWIFHRFWDVGLVGYLGLD